MGTMKRLGLRVGLRLAAVAVAAFLLPPLKATAAVPSRSSLVQSRSLLARLIEALNEDDLSASLGRIKGFSPRDIQVIQVSSVINESNRRVYESSRAKTLRLRPQMLSAMEASSVLSSFLSSSGISRDRVVAVQVDPSSAVTVFVE